MLAKNATPISSIGRVVLVVADDAMDALFELIILRGNGNGMIGRSASLDLFFANTRYFAQNPFTCISGKRARKLRRNVLNISTCRRSAHQKVGGCSKSMGCNYGVLCCHPSTRF